MKFTIQQINFREVNVKGSPKKKVGIKSNGVWYGAFVGKWNESWKVGDSFEVPDDRVKKSEVGDKTYWDIKGPERENGGMAPDAIKRFENTLAAIRRDLEAIKGHLGLAAGDDYQEPQQDSPDF